jgi:hypothetical protein
MVAFLYRMGNAIAGDYNREAAGGTIEPGVADPANPIAAYGLPVVLDTAGTRGVQTGDTAVNLYGVIVRPYPTQATPPATLGAQQLLSTPAVPPTQGTIDILRRGYVGVAVNSGSASSAVKGSAVYIWTAATTTGHTEGGFEAASSGGNTIAAPATFMGPVDSNNLTELAWNI